MTETYNVLIISTNPQNIAAFETVFKSTRHSLKITNNEEAVEKELQQTDYSVIVLDGDTAWIEIAAYIPKIITQFPYLPVIIYSEKASSEFIRSALRAGASDCVDGPIRKKALLDSIKASKKRWQPYRQTVDGLKDKQAALTQHLDALETLTRLGKSIASSLDLDTILEALVDAGVKLTGAEEGSILLVDEATGELFLRAGREFQEGFGRTFHLPVNDTLAGNVIQTGKPVLLDEDTPKKIKTNYLVHSLLYVPLKMREKVIGVLGVDNRVSRASFSEFHKAILSSIADFAAIAIENARLYTNTNIERKKLESILTQVQDGVLVLGSEHRLLWVNKTACSALHLDEKSALGQPANQVLHQSELLFLLEDDKQTTGEITLDDERIFSIQRIHVQDVGLVVTMHDITHLKKLDRLKSDFVSTVSHDLRSPLTAIIGYTDLLGRAGPLNPQQRDFIRRVEASVLGITALINDLLDLSRIEAGYDTQKEEVSINKVVVNAVEDMDGQIAHKLQKLTTKLGKDIPPILGNPIQLRQMLDNLVENATKYTPTNGKIQIRTSLESGQVIVRIVDNGPGIPTQELPFIFDKFYRASNISSDISGTGLGLSIVKSIVDNHQARIWVDSKLGSGAKVTIVFPVHARDGEVPGNGTQPLPHGN